MVRHEVRLIDVREWPDVFNYRKLGRGKLTSQHALDWKQVSSPIRKAIGSTLYPTAKLGPKRYGPFKVELPKQYWLG